MTKPNELSLFLNASLRDYYNETNLRVKLHDTNEHSTYYDFFIADPALNCDHHVLNIKSEVLDFMCQRIRIITGLKTEVVSKGILVYHNPKGVH